MALRTITYTVTASGIEPATVRQGGIQGEHNVTELAFTLPSGFVSTIKEKAGSSAVYYRFDGYTGSGVMASTVPKLLPEESATGDIKLTYPLENWLTRDGGNIEVHLVITAVSTDEETSLPTTENELFSGAALIRLKARHGRTVYDRQHESMTTLALQAEGFANKASNSEMNAQTYANDAEEAKKEAKNCKIKETAIVNDKLIITYKNGEKIDVGTVKGNKGDTGPQGPQGEQGIQGAPGKDGAIVSLSAEIVDGVFVLASDSLTADIVDGVLIIE